jgi:hypothetical protein
MDQQMMNGNSNGEPMAKNGASINNAGFRALPKAVQDQIISNMEYGGYSLPKLQGGDWYTSGQWDAAMQQPVQPTQPQQGNWYNEAQWDAGMNAFNNPTTQPMNPNLSQDERIRQMGYTPSREVSWNTPESSWNQAAQNQSSDNWYTEDQWNQATQGQQPATANKAKTANTPKASNTTKTSQTKQSKSEPTLGDMMMDAGRSMTSTPTEQQMRENTPYTARLYTTSNTPEGGISPTGKSVYASAKSLDEYVSPWMDLIPNALDMTESQFQSSVYDYALKNDPQSISNMWKEFGLTNLGKADKELFGLTKNGKFDEESLKDPKVLAKLKKAYVDGKLGARTLKPTKSAPNEPDFGRELEPKKGEPGTPKDNKDNKNNYDGDIDTVRPGRYTRAPYDLTQAIPSVMGLAASQETFPYAIPEIDSPYIRPQTLNIQSQLQDIDNMGQASVRAGADPLSAYIAGIGGKERAFQSKQNFDAQGRMQADMFNAQAQQRADMMNAQMFDRTYNQMIAQARDAATAEQQAAIASLVQKQS